MINQSEPPNAYIPFANISNLPAGKYLVNGIVSVSYAGGENVTVSCRVIMSGVSSTTSEAVSQSVGPNLTGTLAITWGFDTTTINNTLSIECATSTFFRSQNINLPVVLLSAIKVEELNPS